MGHDELTFAISGQKCFLLLLNHDDLTFAIQYLLVYLKSTLIGVTTHKQSFANVYLRFYCGDSLIVASLGFYFFSIILYKHRFQTVPKIAGYLQYKTPQVYHHSPHSQQPPF